MISSVVSQVFGGGLKAVDGLMGRFFTNKDKVEGNLHSEQMAAMSALAAEFGHRADRTWWDSCVDGLNRLPRPALAIGALGMLLWAPLDPIGFAAAMQAYALMPEWLALVIAQIILLFAGGRMLEKWSGRMGGPKPEAVESVLAAMDRIRALDAPSSSPHPVQVASGGLEPLAPEAPPALSEMALATEMADHSSPLSNAAILEWNRRRRAQAGSGTADGPDGSVD